MKNKKLTSILGIVGAALLLAVCAVIAIIPKGERCAAEQGASAKTPIMTPPVTAEDDDPSGVIVEDFTRAPAEDTPEPTAEIPDDTITRGWKPYDYSIDFYSLPDDVLEKVKTNSGGIGNACYYPKQILKIIGWLPEDVPSLTLEQAKAVCAELKGKHFDNFDDAAYECMLRFNEFAGAPDFDGGSGTWCARYYLDGDNGSIRIDSGYIEYHWQKGQEPVILFSIFDD